MSLTATASSIPGTLRQEVVIDGRHRLITDEPERLGGEGSGPAPHELFPAALAACVSTPRRFDVAVELGGDLTDEQLQRLEKVAASCPVRRAVEAGIEFDETIVCCLSALAEGGVS
jgi:putative redox protein